MRPFLKNAEDWESWTQSCSELGTRLKFDWFVMLVQIVSNTLLKLLSLRSARISGRC